MNFFWGGFGFLFFISSTAAFAEFKVDHRISLQGSESWDYLAVEQTSDRLFVTRSNRVDVFDLKTEKLLGSISQGIEGAHGVAFAPRQKKGYITSGKSEKVISFDLENLKVIKEIQAGKKPDAIAFDEMTSRVYAFNGGDNSVTVIDAVKDQVVKTLKLDGRPEFAVSDNQGKIFLNCEDKGTLSEIDAQKMEVTKTWSLAGCDSPSGLAADFAHHRLFSVCENEVMVVSDNQAGKTLSKIAIGKGPDAAGFDKGLVFSSNGYGSLTIVKEKSPEQFELLQNLSTQPSARTLAIDPKTQSIYLIAAKYEKPDGKSPKQKAKIVPGTVELIVVKP